jgi:hypothetical protein
MKIFVKKDQKNNWKITISVLGILWNVQGERIARQFVFHIFRFIYRDKWRL